MKIALCTTTIHVPHALRLMRKCSSEVMFIVTGDRKTPDNDVVALLEQCGDHMYLGYDAQRGWKCHGRIGPNTLARRNIAFLEALYWGADVIYSWDNDNAPISTRHIDLLRDAFYMPFNGIRITGRDFWFDPGQFLRPPLPHRGFPINRRHRPFHEPVVDAKVGVAAGLILGDPDIDAVTRIARQPVVGDVALLAQTGCVVNPQTWTVYNTQNTAVVRELVPAWFLMPDVGRYDDIFASLIVQRVMRDRGYHIHFGPPFVLQQRNEHDLIDDLRAEIDGMANIERLAYILDHIVLMNRSVIDDTRKIYETLANAPFIPERAVKAAMAYLDDCEEVMK